MTTGAEAESRDVVAGRVAELLALVERTLGSVLPAPDAVELDQFASRRLVEAMRYSLGTPGKRLRPLLCLAAAEACGADPQPLAAFASGLEMIHAYSLIHDDLPAMDDDELRRGQPTNHIVYGDGMAILAGDGLLTEAFGVLLRPVADPALQMRVVAEVALAAGYTGMVGGQAADLMAEGLQAEEELLHSIHARKTGALIRSSVRAGALLGGGCDKDLATLTAFASRFGLAFQIADDVKDEIMPETVSGKTGGSDREAGKVTYPSLFGIEGSLGRCREELELSVAALRGLGGRAAMLELVARDSIAPVLEAAGG
ncbi:MAG: farnesyl diphosphate synthase [Deltaproteobacteria bacterium]|jgi:geranylgeranyl diphosphate synthase type II